MGLNYHSKDHKYRKTDRSKEDASSSKHRSDKSPARHHHSSSRSTRHRNTNSPSHHRDSKKLSKEKPVDKEIKKTEERRISSKASTSSKSVLKKTTEKSSAAEKSKSKLKIPDESDLWTPELPPSDGPKSTSSHPLQEKSKPHQKSTKTTESARDSRTVKVQSKNEPSKSSSSKILSEKSKKSLEITTSSKFRAPKPSKSLSSKHKSESSKSEPSKAKCDSTTVKRSTLGTMLLSKDEKTESSDQKTLKIEIKNVKTEDASKLAKTSTSHKQNSFKVEIPKTKSKTDVKPSQKIPSETVKMAPEPSVFEIIPEPRKTKFSVLESENVFPDFHVLDLEINKRTITSETPTQMPNRVIIDTRSVQVSNSSQLSSTNVQKTPAFDESDDENFTVVDTSMLECNKADSLANTEKIHVKSFSISNSSAVLAKKEPVNSKHTENANSDLKSADLASENPATVEVDKRKIRSSKRKHKKLSSDDEEEQNSSKRSKKERSHKTKKSARHKKEKESKRRRKSKSSSYTSSSSSSSASSRYRARKRRRRYDRRSPAKRATNALGSFFDPNIARELLMAANTTADSTANDNNAQTALEQQSGRKPSVIQVNKRKMMMNDYQDKWTEIDRQAALFETSRDDDSSPPVTHDMAESEVCEYMSVPIIECPHLLKEFIEQSTIDELMFGGYKQTRVQRYEICESQKKWRSKILAETIIDC